MAVLERVATRLEHLEAYISANAGCARAQGEAGRGSLAASEPSVPNRFVATSEETPSGSPLPKMPRCMGGPRNVSDGRILHHGVQNACSARCKMQCLLQWLGADAGPRGTMHVIAWLKKHRVIREAPGP